jgi:hypothetical protein
MKIYNELESLGFFEWLSETHNLSDTDMKPKYLDELPLNDIHITVCNSMAFRWFREKYDLQCWPEVTGSNRYSCRYDGNDETGKRWVGYLKDYNGQSVLYSKYEEAELACLIKLISIVKEKL